MDFIADIPVIGTLVLVVLPFLLVLSIVVFVHEYGHYIVGKWMGIKAEVFSIGFGPSLFGWRDSSGTYWQVAALPLGGFVKFTGDMDPASAGKQADAELAPEDRARAFHNAPLYARAATVAAGPIFNFILAAIFIAILAMTFGRPMEIPIVGEINDEIAETGLKTGDRVLTLNGKPIEDIRQVIGALGGMSGEPVPVTLVRDGVEQQIDIRYVAEPVIAALEPRFPAKKAGLKVGDRVLTVNGVEITSYTELRTHSISRGEGKPVDLVIDRDGKELKFSLLPRMIEREHPISGEVERVPTMGLTGGVQGLEMHREVLGPISALVYGVDRTWYILYRTVTYLGEIITGAADASQLGGPIGIAQISGKAFSDGLDRMIELIAIISASIGLINLFPIPVLDGGHLMFYSLEALRGRPVGEHAMRIGNVIGLSLVLLLMVFATYNDVLRF